MYNFILMPMKNKRLICIGILSSLAVVFILYACTDKIIETESADVATTRALNEVAFNKYYKVLPGTPEWEKLESGEEMWEVCQLPENMLRELSTEELIEACLQFPLAYDFTAFDDERSAIDRMIKEFNGLSELKVRNDATIKMIEAYQNMEYSDKLIKEEEVSSDAKCLGLTIAYWELVMADNDFLRKMNAEEKDFLKSVALGKYQMKLEHSDYFGLRNIEHSLLICAELALAGDKSFSEEERQLLVGYTHVYTLYAPEGLEYISRLVF